MSALGQMEPESSKAFGMESEVIRQLKEQLTGNESISVFVIPHDKTGRVDQTSGNKADPWGNRTSEYNIMNSPEESRDSREVFTIDDATPIKPRIRETGQVGPYSRPPVVVEKEKTPTSGDKPLKVTASRASTPKPTLLHTHNANKDIQSPTSSVLDSSTLSPRPQAGTKELDTSHVSNASSSSPQNMSVSRAAQQDSPQNTNQERQSPMQCQSNVKSKSDTELTVNHNQKYNLREIRQMPVRFSPTCTKEVASRSRGRKINLKKKTCIKITLPLLMSDNAENGLVSIFSELAKFHGCTTNVERKADYVIQPRPGEGAQVMPQQGISLHHPHPQLPALQAHSHTQHLGQHMPILPSLPLARLPRVPPLNHYGKTREHNQSHFSVMKSMPMAVLQKQLLLRGSKIIPASDGVSQSQPEKSCLPLYPEILLKD